MLVVKLFLLTSHLVRQRILICIQFIYIGYNEVF
jgi:hypothetical protein